ncbi:hypothetical protein GTA08_BOTSDO09162 [Neofusicoccum parvum]|uniref:Uncharacterized protein n=1 Tax=Neofusicoccum parvum TaxID=310453 RepID=A0ACB5SNW5_9PEZI|nr:hypothetical protein GTA08_BOTSDO09162 [Neofusicoccum parvum]GME50408.1 hypothetical protein GTA08_BOTSDO09162 [Neofusicoccum parvum]
MAGILNIGDVLMLSQLAWKIGRAFTAGRKGAPAEFVSVEAEVSGLAKALKLLAETLFAENIYEENGDAGGGGRGKSGDGMGGILGQASAETRGGVEVILISCQRTLKDLESLVEQYQVIRKHRTSGGFSIERNWSDLVLSSYKKMLWTTEGGNIQELRNMLHMHTSTISLTMLALQSKSLARLEEIVHPMAEKVDEIHSAVTGDLSDKIQEVHAIVMAIAGASPRLNPRDSRASDLPLWDSPLMEPMPESLRASYHSRSTISPQRSPEIVPLDSMNGISYPRRRYSRRESDTSTAPSLSEASDRRSSGGAFSTATVARVTPGSPVADGVEIVPHASYFVPEKISLPLVTELKFHDTTYGAKPLKVEKTTWINYVFEDVKSATLFQNELMGKTLVGVFKTEKTLRIHEGLSGVLAYQEQMCGMENLRLWEDPENGGILAMIHFSAHFRPGYLAFYLNSSACPVRVKDEGGKEIKIKGLKIPLDRYRAGVGGRRGSEVGRGEGKKWITGAKVEFAGDVEKFLFLEKVKEVQQTMILLPDV